MQADSLNVPNALTIGRIALVPALVWLILEHPKGSLPATVLFATLALTDVLDGHLARSRGLVTTLGKLLDPMADKLLVGGALIALAATERLAVAIVVVILAREVLVTSLRIVAYRRGVVMDAGGFGKAKMGLQVAMVLGLVAGGTEQPLVLEAVVAATVAVTVASGLDYLLGYRRGMVAQPV
jgi:CDP-diacylglycerol--glycerol-3-phosphate 3-phosphatidyltransferase